jgi:hypothetical protein
MNNIPACTEYVFHEFLCNYCMMNEPPSNVGLHLPLTSIVPFARVALLIY